MDDALLVRGVQCVCDLPGDGQRLVDGDRAVCNAIRQGWSLDQLHDERTDAIASFQAVDARDVRVIQRRQGLGFSFESCKALRVLGERVGEHLDGHRSRQVRVGRPIHLTHAAHADSRADFVRTEASTWCERHGSGKPPRL